MATKAGRRSVTAVGAPRAAARRSAAPAWGLLAGLVLMALAVAVPPLTGWHVHVTSPPLTAGWKPRTGRGTGPAVLLAVLAAAGAIHAANRLTWRWLLLSTFGAGLAWMLALAYVDGWDGIATPLNTPFEYLPTARATTDIPALLHEFVSRVGSTAPDRWPAHVAAHPPGALLFFVALDRVGLGSGLGAGLAVIAIAATTSVAVLVTLRTLGAERFARRAAPFLVFAPAAIWQAVSADAMFAAVAAWTLAMLAIAAVRRRGGWAVGAGLLFGACLFLSYGLALLAILALAVLWLAGSWRPLVAAVLATLAVVGVFAALGVPYWSALSAVHERYWAPGGLGAARPAGYWLWADLAALLFCTGPLAAAGLSRSLALPIRLRRDGPRPAALVPVALGLASLATVLLADASLMSKAEVERIWLPFVPWLLLPIALLPLRWRRAGLVLQLATALLIQHLLHPIW